MHINPESRVRVEAGRAKPELVEGGTRLFLVKVINEAHVTAPLAVQSANTGPVYRRSSGSPRARMEVTEAHVRDRWADISIYDKPPLRPRLSGLGIEYVILEVFSRDAGQRSANGQLQRRTGHSGHRLPQRHGGGVHVDAGASRPARRERRARSAHDRRIPDPRFAATGSTRTSRSGWSRISSFNRRSTGATAQSIALPPGSYKAVVTRGPEYDSQTMSFDVPGVKELALKLARWIDPSRDGYYSGDHHIHSAGCSHYENPTEGVTPESMWPQIEGEALNLASVLIWGPSYYHQKQFFTGQDHPLSKPDRLMRYDLEISGFPSSHAGHLVLLGVKDQDYPGTKQLEDWPTWTFPILRWGKSQGAVVGFAHSGWGLEVKSKDLPNYEMPGFDGIGANEYIVDVTHPDTVDFISAGDTPYVWELNIWYHTLNVGFRTRISGETDFPCIYDDNVGLARSYCKVDGPLTYRKWIDAVRAGRNYVSDGKSHLFDFSVNGVEAGTRDSEVQLDRAGPVKVTLRAAAKLDEQPNDAMRQLKYDEKPYWALERARIGASREVPVELIVNGAPVAVQKLVADGTMRTLTFNVTVDQSSWIAARIIPSSHTNPVFVTVGGKPIRASRQSAEWCVNAVNQCWTQKAARIRASELEEARKAYDHARQVYRQRLAETTR